MEIGTNISLPYLLMDLVLNEFYVVPVPCEKFYLTGVSGFADTNGYYIPYFTSSLSSSYLPFRHELKNYTLIWDYDSTQGIVLMSGDGSNYDPGLDVSNFINYSKSNIFTVEPFDTWFNSQGNITSPAFLSGVPTTAAKVVDVIQNPQNYPYINTNSNIVYEDGTNPYPSTYNFINDYVSARLYKNNGAGEVVLADPVNISAAYHYIPAASVSIDNGPQLAPRRVLGSNVEQNNQFRIGAAPQTKLSFSAYIETINNSLNAILDSSGDASYDIRVGNNVYSGCYLNTYSIDVTPFKTCMISADYMVTIPPTGDYITTTESIDFIQIAPAIIFGHTCSVSGAEQVVDTIQTSMKYSVNCGRTPSYSLGEINPRVVFLDTVEKQMDITSTNLQSLINYSGYQLGTNLGFTLKDAQNVTGAIITMNSGAKLLSQKYSVQESDVLATQVSIKEIVV
jgi:hypothetical protein